ncbi:MAG: sigma-70 family RNA polymerase sigma factor [Lachnospiraceae bacterium]|nr:sigma-70 family RNA polymerase sigma factor [Lachnospiraceae bacterium]
MTDNTFCTMYKLYYEKLLSFANTHLSDYFLSEDLVQDTFLYFYEHTTLEDFSTRKDIFSLLTQKLLSLIPTEDSDLPLPNNSSIQLQDTKTSFLLLQSMTQAVLNQKKHICLYNSLFSLTMKEKKILYLHVIKKMNAKEISLRLALTHCSVRKQMERIRKKVCKQYALQIRKDQHHGKFYLQC